MYRLAACVIRIVPCLVPLKKLSKFFGSVLIFGPTADLCEAPSAKVDVQELQRVTWRSLLEPPENYGNRLPFYLTFLKRLVFP